MKKLTYLVASLVIAVAAGTTLTGCINSDEPAGIEQLREAKAALLKSKQALIEAQAAKTLAEAEAVKVEAAAQAALIEAQKAKTEAETEDIKQRTALAVAEAQERINYLQQQLENLKLTYEQEKLNLSEQQKQFVEYYYNKYFNALEEYNCKYVAWLEAQKQLVASALDPEGTKFDEKKGYEEAVTEAEKSLADANEEIAALTDSLAVVKTWKPSELGAKLTQYQEELDANYEQIRLIDLKIAENENESEEGKLYKELDTEVGDLLTEWITIPAYTFNADGNITIPGIEQPDPVLGESRYSLNDNWNYYAANDNLNNKKNALSEYVLNDNGEAWTQAEINELTRGKAEYDKTYEADLEKWQMFVTAYNKGAEPEYKALEGYDAINDAVTAYNKSLAPLEAAKAELIKAEEAAFEARKALNNEAADKAQEAKYAAYAAADAARETAQIAAQEEYDATKATLDEAVEKAQINLTEGEAKRVAAENLSNKYPEDADLKKAAEDAGKAVEALQKTYDDAVKARDEQKPKAQTKMNKAIDVANAAYEVAIAEADKAFALAMAEVRKEETALNEASTAADSKFNEAGEAYSIELGKAHALLEEVVNAVTKQVETLGGDTNEWLYSSYYQKFLNATTYYPIAENPDDVYWVEARKAFETEIPECTVAEVCAYQSENLKQNVIDASHTLYGWVYTPKAYDSAYLVPLTKEELINYIIEHDFGGSKPDNYSNALQERLENNYGSYGKVLACENRIEVAQAYISQKAAVDAAFAELDKRIEDLTASYEAQEEKVEKAKEERDKALQAVEDLNAELNDQRNELYSKNNIAYTMIEAIQNAAYQTGVAYEPNYTQETIDQVIANLETAIEEKENIIPDLEKAIEKAKYLLDQYEKGLLSASDLAQFEVEKAKLALDVAKAKLDEAKAQLDAANKRLDEAAA